MLRATLPLHIILGALTGCALAEDKFVRPGSQPWYKAIAPPVLLHGLFDLVIPVAATAHSLLLVYALSILIVAAATALARRRFLRVLAALPPQQLPTPIDIHAQIKTGAVRAPSKWRVVLMVLVALAVCAAFLVFVLPTVLHAVATAGGTSVESDGSEAG